MGSGLELVHAGVWRWMRFSKSGAVVRTSARRSGGGFSGAAFLAVGFGEGGCVGCGAGWVGGGVAGVCLHILQDVHIG